MPKPLSARRRDVGRRLQQIQKRARRIMETTMDETAYRQAAGRATRAALLLDEIDAQLDPRRRRP
jgi:hypothetical protein